MYASSKLIPGPQTEAVRVGVTARADNPVEEVIPMEVVRIDKTADVGADTAQAGDAEDNKVATTPTDRGRGTMRVHDQASASTGASTAGLMVTACKQVRNVSHRQLDAITTQPL